MKESVRIMNKIIHPARKFKQYNKNKKEIDAVDDSINTFIPTPSTPVKKYAKFYVSNLSDEQKIRIKKMIEMGIAFGKSIAQVYNIPADEFEKEIKAII